MHRIGILLGSLLAFARIAAADWASFLGPTSDGRTTSPPLLQSLPASGPPVAWELRVGTGYSAPSVIGDRLVVFHRLASTNPAAQPTPARRGQSGFEVIDCLNRHTGKLLWRQAFPTSFEDPYGYNNGPRCSPVLSSNRVFFHGAEGRLASLDLSDGRILWQNETANSFRIPEAFFGVGSTPWLEQGRLYVMTGGQPNAGVCAFDSESGKLIWSSVGKATWDGATALGWRGEPPYSWSGEEKLASYSSLRMVSLHGRRHLLALMRQGLVSLNPTNGELNFKRWFQCQVNDSVNAMTPVVENGKILISAAYYRSGSVLLEAGMDGKTLKELWRDPTDPWQRDAASGRFVVPSLECHWSTPLLHEGFLYAFSGRNEPDATFRCVEWSTGKMKWSRDERWAPHSATQPAVFGRGSLILADGKLIALGEGGLLGLFRPNPEKCEELGRWQVPKLEYPCWAGPILVDSQLFLRSESYLICLDLARR